MRRQRAPDQEIDLVIPPRGNSQNLHVCEEEIPQRPIHHRPDALGIVPRDVSDHRREVPEVERAAFFIGGTFALGFEDFREVSDDGSPN